MYDSSLHVNPAIRNFWNNLRKSDSDFHVFKKNRNLVYFGNNLSKDSYDYVMNRAKKLNVDTDLSYQSSVFHQILEKENGHEEALKELAKKAVFDSFEIPSDILELDLNEDNSVELNKTEEKEKLSYSKLDRETQKLINKRILMNCIIQGSSIHAFYTLHHLVKEDLNKLIPNIVSLYDSLSVGTVASYWVVDYSRFVANEAFSGNIALGSSKVEYEDKETPKVKAKAKTFTVLCQEIVKGGMECICLHGLQDIPEDQLEIVYSFSDRRIDEPRYIQIGSEVWRKLLSFYKSYKEETKEGIPDYIMKIAKLDPDSIENFFENIFENNVEKSMSIIL